MTSDQARTETNSELLFKDYRADSSRPVPQVSCIIPTMNRPALLKQTLTRLFESTQGIDVEAVVVIDDNAESVDVCDALIAEGKNIVYSYSKERRGAIYCWNYGLKLARADKFVHQGDDIWYEDEWLSRALAAHQEKLQGFGLVALNDSMHNADATVATHALWDKRFTVECLGGVMATPVYRYFCVDSEFTGRAKKAGRFYWCRDAVIKHIHPANGGRPVDDTDRSHGDDAWNYDIPLFEQRMNAGFPNDFEPTLI